MGPFYRDTACMLLLLLLSRFSCVRPCATPCDPIDGSPPVSTILGILQARTLEWVAIVTLHVSDQKKKKEEIF